LQSRDCVDARNADGGQGVKSAMNEMEESPYCTTLDAISRVIYKQKIKTYVGRDPYVMKRTDFQLN